MIARLSYNRTLGRLYATLVLRWKLVRCGVDFDVYQNRHCTFVCATDFAVERGVDRVERAVMRRRPLSLPR